MNYIYHQVPRELTGRKLLPLTQLKEKNKSAYEAAVKKYQGREQQMHQKIPVLNCLWKEVLHLTAVQPHKIDELLKECGLSKGLINRDWFKIDPRLLRHEKTTVWLYPKRYNVLKSEDFVSFNIADIEKYNELNADTKSYYTAQIQEGKRPLLFHRVPHILYCGTLPLNKLEIINI